MVEEIFNYVAPIAIIPPNQLMIGQINQLRRSLSRTRKKETKDMLNKQIQLLEVRLEDYLKSIGR